MAAFCRFWRMTPQEASELAPEVYSAFVDYANREIREANRAARKR